MFKLKCEVATVVCFSKLFKAGGFYKTQFNIRISIKTVMSKTVM